MTLTCDEALRQNELLMEGLPVANTALLDQHLDSCSQCRDAMEQSTSSDQWETLTAALRAGGPIDDKIPAEHRPSAARDAFIHYLAPSDDPASIGRIGNMEVRGVIGYGGAGIVYKAHDAALGRNVAIKLLNPTAADQPTARTRFAREARAMAAIRHENVVPVYAVADHGDIPYFVMEYVAGGTLAQRVADAGPLSTLETVRVGLQIAQALAAAHRHGVIHRDVKPSNILLDPGVERVRVTDFGLAQAQGDRQETETGLLVGTPQYMSPEQVRGDELDGRSDLFSLGSVMFFCCTGKVPFESNSVYATMQSISKGDASEAKVANEEVPEWLSQLVNRLHEVEPGKRIQSADQLVEILETELAYLHRPGAVERPRREWLARARCGSHRVWLMAILLLAFIGMTAWMVPQDGKRKKEISPFTKVECPTPMTAVVEYDGRSYDLVSVNGHSTKAILTYCRERYDDLWEKRFAEDLVAVLTGLGEEVNGTVKLELREPKTQIVITVEAAEMTRMNRQLVYATRNGLPVFGGTAERRGFPTVSPFTDVSHPTPEKAIVQYAGRRYELVSMEGRKTAAILRSCRQEYGDLWEKRFAEDLVEVLHRIGLRVGQTVAIEIRDPETRVVTSVPNAMMTQANRRAIYQVRAQREAAESASTPKKERRGFALASPFTRVTHRSPETALVQFEGTEYELISIAEIKTAEVLRHCRSKYGDDWDKRFAEDLVEVLDGLGKKVVQTIALELRLVETGNTVKVAAAPMTKANRDLVYQSRHPADGREGISFYDAATDTEAQREALQRFHQ
ncbi:MAG: serine/threonine-protein kinase, partial [Planctomycetota bacterium]